MFCCEHCACAAEPWVCTNTLCSQTFLFSHWHWALYPTLKAGFWFTRILLFHGKIKEMMCCEQCMQQCYPQMQHSLTLNYKQNALKVWKIKVNSDLRLYTVWCFGIDFTAALTCMLHLTAVVVQDGVSSFIYCQEVKSTAMHQSVAQMHKVFSFVTM